MTVTKTVPLTTTSILPVPEQTSADILDSVQGAIPARILKGGESLSLSAPYISDGKNWVWVRLHHVGKLTTAKRKVISAAVNGAYLALYKQVARGGYIPPT
jgi:hypothetical protein